MNICGNRVPGGIHQTIRLKGQGGFTAVEAMIVILVISVLVAVAAPGFWNLIGNNRLVSEVYSLRAALNNARSEALARRETVVVCPSTDGAACANSDDWSTGYIAFIDADGNNAIDPNNPTEELLYVETDEQGVEIAFDNALRRVRFGAQGVALGFDGVFTFCDSRGANSARGLIINPVGTVRSATDTDSPEDGIVNDDGGNNVACN
ncbi:MAG: GspH/FimT family pseudopilin [Pseudomonadota bacterium]